MSQTLTQTLLLEHHSDVKSGLQFPSLRQRANLNTDAIRRVKSLGAIPSHSDETPLCPAKTASVFVDLDGTLLSTEMAPAIFHWICMEPNFWLRMFKFAILPVFVLICTIVSKFSDANAIRMLAWIALFGVSVEEAASRNKLMAPWLMSKVRPGIAAHIKQHQLEGREVVILTGNLSPLITSFCEQIGCKCITTVPAVDSTGKYYTGGVVGTPNVHSQKVTYVERSEVPRDRLFGYGNTKSDIAFLSIVGNPRVVKPDSKLSRHASENGWPIATH